LKFCCNITVKNNDIKRIKMKRCYGNIFKSNKISNMGKLKRRDKKEKINQIERLFIVFSMWLYFGFLLVIFLVICFVRPGAPFFGCVYTAIFIFIIGGLPSIYVSWIVVLVPLKHNIRLKKWRPNKFDRSTLFGKKDSGLEFPNLIEKR